MSTTGFWGLVFMFIIVIAFCSSIRKRPTLKTGDICTIDAGNGKYGIIKILSIEPERIHIKLFANRFIVRPEKIDIADLYMLSVDDEAANCAEHLPMDKGNFTKLDAQTVGSQSITREEANNYLTWNG